MFKGEISKYSNVIVSRMGVINALGGVPKQMFSADMSLQEVSRPTTNDPARTAYVFPSSGTQAILWDGDSGAAVRNSYGQIVGIFSGFEFTDGINKPTYSNVYSIVDNNWYLGGPASGMNFLDLEPSKVTNYYVDMLLVGQIGSTVNYYVKGKKYTADPYTCNSQQNSNSPIIADIKAAEAAGLIPGTDFMCIHGSQFWKGGAGRIEINKNIKGTKTIAKYSITVSPF